MESSLKTMFLRLWSLTFLERDECDHSKALIGMRQSSLLFPAVIRRAARRTATQQVKRVAAERRSRLRLPELGVSSIARVESVSPQLGPPSQRRIGDSHGIAMRRHAQAGGRHVSSVQRNP